MECQKICTTDMRRKDKFPKSDRRLKTGTYEDVEYGQCYIELEAGHPEVCFETRRSSRVMIYSNSNSNTSKTRVCTCDFCVSCFRRTRDR